MVGEVTLQGIGVSGGIAVAPLFCLPESERRQRAVGAPPEEQAALREAIESASAALLSLIEGLDEEAAAILEFQLLLLEDDDLLAPIFAAVTEGAAADIAWREAIDREIAEYAAGDDEVFAARASDLADLRDRVLTGLFGGAAQFLPPEPSILVARDLAPSRFLEIDSSLIAGIALGEGSRTSHVSLLARAKGLPLIVGIGTIPQAEACETAILDAAHGSLVIAPSDELLAQTKIRLEEMTQLHAQAQALAGQTAVTASGEAVSVLVNVDHPSVLDSLPVDHCDGVGLTRTEFLFQTGGPTEDEQLAVYRRILRWAEGRPVTIRTLDAGGDKPIPGITLDGESNPFLGVRGLRLSLRRPEVFRVQFRALLRAACDGELKVMVPMVTDPAEMVAVRRLADDVAEELRQEGLPFRLPALGMMIEVPAAALAAGDFDADFYSIGTNDLVQYATACARDNAALAALARSDHPGVLRLIEAVVAAGRTRGVEVSVCGDMASDAREAHLLLLSGVRSLSVAPAEIGRVKAAISGFGAEDV